MQHFCFNSQTRKAGESVTTYVAEVRTLAEHCNFGDTLEKMLCDHLLMGIKDDGIQKKLLAEPKRTYKRALEMAQGCEEAEKNLREMRASQHVTPNFILSKQDVHKLTSARKLKPTSSCTCYCCRKPTHKTNDCKFRDQSCHKCGKKGHLAKVYRNLGTSQHGKHKQLHPEKQRKPIQQV